MTSVASVVVGGGIVTWWVVGDTPPSQEGEVSPTPVPERGGPGVMCVSFGLSDVC